MTTRPTTDTTLPGLLALPGHMSAAIGAHDWSATSLGACASFLYNLRHALDDIRSGRARVAFVGTAEAPITPEVMEGYAAMGALATEKGLRKLDGLADDDAPDLRRAYAAWRSRRATG